MRYIIESMSGRSDVPEQVGVEHNIDIDMPFYEGSATYYTIDFDSLHELREFTDEYGRVVTSHELPVKQGDEDYDDIDGTLTLIDRNFFAFPSEAVRYL